MTTEIFDCKGRLITLDAPVDGGNAVTGKIVRIHEPDEDLGGVSVEWPEWPNEPEYFAARVSWQSGHAICDDIELLDERTVRDRAAELARLPMDERG